MRSRNPGLDLPVADKASVDLIALFQLLLDLALGRPQLIGWKCLECCAQCRACYSQKNY
jgi:hypothetical protein